MYIIRCLDVNEDPVIIVDGLTKNHRLPGWRVCWLVAPKQVIFSMQSAGSFLEGNAYMNNSKETWLTLMLIRWCQSSITSGGHSIPRP
jgi:hypothetical protein